MLIPIVVSSIFVLAVIVLCLAKPNAGRIFLGFFFLLMALGVNGSFTFGNPQAYIDYAQGALIPFYRDLAVQIVSISPQAFGLLLMLYEIALGGMLLYKGKWVKIGLAGSVLFLIGIAPLSWVQLPWLGVVIAGGLLFRREFDRSLVEMIRRRNPAQSRRMEVNPDSSG